MFSINSVDLYSNKKSGKKIFNIKKNDQYKTSCLFDEKKDKFIAIILKNEKQDRLLIFDAKEVPTLQKGSGLISFKAKGFNLVSIHSLDDSLTFYNYQKKILDIDKNMKKYLSKRGKPGKTIKVKNNKIFRGFENNYL
tara:strand:- start:253 stop:666 length:414 start_codon:yes stop_codon:yes gene_type:complete